MPICCINFSCANMKKCLFTQNSKPMIHHSKGSSKSNLSNQWWFFLRGEEGLIWGVLITHNFIVAKSHSITDNDIMDPSLVTFYSLCIMFPHIHLGRTGRNNRWNARWGSCDSPLILLITNVNNSIIINMFWLAWNIRCPHRQQVGSILLDKGKDLYFNGSQQSPDQGRLM